MHFRWITILFFFRVAMDQQANASNENCETVGIMKCITAKNQASSQLLFPDTAQKLREYCEHLMEGLNCARRIIDDCIPERDRNLYYNLTHDMVEMNIALCTPGSPFSTRFLQHVDCYKGLSERFKSCSDRYIGNIVVVQPLAREEQMKMTCCTVHEYSRCMRNAIEGRCDDDAQQLIEETVVNTLRQPFGYCNQLAYSPTNVNCLSSFSASKGHATADAGNQNNSGMVHHSSSGVVFIVLVFCALLAS